MNRTVLVLLIFVVLLALWAGVASWGWQKERHNREQLAQAAYVYRELLDYALKQSSIDTVSIEGCSLQNLAQHVYNHVAQLPDGSLRTTKELGEFFLQSYPDPDRRKKIIVGHKEDLNPAVRRELEGKSRF